MIEVTKEALAEVRGPIIATTLVLMAVFVPVSFIPGMTGQLYNQFSLTIALAVGLSGINSLTLSPALCAVFLKPGGKKKKNILFRAFNSGFERLATGYAQAVRWMSKLWYVTMSVCRSLCADGLSFFRDAVGLCSRGGPGLCDGNRQPAQWCNDCKNPGHHGPGQ